MRRFTRRLLFGLGVLSAIAVVVMSSIFAAQTGASAQTSPEKIVSYDVAIAIQHDASILVTEQIVYDFGSYQRHGINREIPVLYTYSKRYDRYYPLAVRSVQSPDAPAQYTVDNTGDTVIVRIGDPSQTVTGIYTPTGSPTWSTPAWTRTPATTRCTGMPSGTSGMSLSAGQLCG
jgi:Predicted membrane protein (DUF2207)